MDSWRDSGQKIVLTLNQGLGFFAQHLNIMQTILIIVIGEWHIG
jgi:hypothetical protein